MKIYKVYKMKYGLNKFKIVDNNGLTLLYRNELKLALAEAILQGQGYAKQGEIEECLPIYIEMEEELEDCETDKEENCKDFINNR